MVATVLRENGYEVLEARTAPRAEAIFESDKARIALLLADMVLPGGSGREVAANLRAEKPGLKVLYTSGYNSSTLPTEIAPEDGSNFIAKPFKLKDLLAKVNELMEPAP